MLKVENVTKMFGGLAAVSDVSVEFEAGRINAIIGPNGAGKSTFFNLISGLHQPTSGRILLDGVDIAKVGLGRLRSSLAIVPQARHLLKLLLMIMA